MKDIYQRKLLHRSINIIKRFWIVNIWKTAMLKRFSKLWKNMVRIFLNKQAVQMMFVRDKLRLRNKDKNNNKMLLVN